jgi:5-methylcytosine-specific restriction protein A
MLPTGLRSMDMRSAQPAAKQAAPFYLAPEWRDLMGAIIAERGRRCEACGRTGTRIFGDHIRELQDGGAALDRRNIRLLCGACHTAKTARARAARMRASPAPPPVPPLP